MPARVEERLWEFPQLNTPDLANTTPRDKVRRNSVQINLSYFQLRRASYSYIGSQYELFCLELAACPNTKAHSSLFILQASPTPTMGEKIALNIDQISLFRVPGLFRNEEAFA